MTLPNYHKLNYYQKNHKIIQRNMGGKLPNLIYKENLIKTEEKTSVAFSDSS